MINIKEVPVEQTPCIARSVPVGGVYSWGTRTSHYLRIAGGSVCLNDGAKLIDSGAGSGHFDQVVVVATSATLQVSY